MAFQVIQTRPDGSVLARGPNGQPTLLTAGNAAALKAAGNLAPQAGANPFAPPAPNMTPAGPPANPFAPQNMSLRPQPAPAPTGPLMSIAPPPPPPNLGDNMTPMQQNMSAPGLPDLAKPQGVSIPKPQQTVFQQSQQMRAQGQQPAQAPSDLFVRTPGTPARWSPDRREVSGISNDQMQEAADRNKEVQDLAFQAAKSHYEATTADAQARVSDAEGRMVRNAVEQDILKKPLEDKKAYVDARIKELDAEGQRVRDLKVDENDFFKQVGVGGSILAAVAVGLGEAGRTLAGTGGGNTAANIINSAIERNVNAQIENIRKQGADHIASQEFFDKYGTRDLDELKLKQMYLGQEYAKAQVEKKAAEKDLAFAQPTLLQTAAAIGQKGLENFNSYVKLQEQKASEKYMQATPGGLKLNKERLAEQQYRKTEAEIGKLNAEGGKANREGDPARDENNVMLGGQVVATAPKATAERLRDGTEAALELHNLVDEMQTIASKGSKLSQSDRDRLMALRAQVRPKIAVANKQGAMSAGDAANIDEGLTDGVDLFLRTGENRLGTTKDVIRKSVRTRLVDVYGGDANAVDAAFGRKQEEKE